jgi:TRAP-type uncharacterized transport system fused permease subunit
LVEPAAEKELRELIEMLRVEKAEAERVLRNEKLMALIPLYLVIAMLYVWMLYRRRRAAMRRVATTTMTTASLTSAEAETHHIRYHRGHRSANATAEEEGV